MLHECLVIDNSNFFKNGTIRVRLKEDVASSAMMRDLSINPKQSINDYGNQRYEKFGNDKEFKYNDEDVKVATSIGGAYDYGLFILPQPNTWGLVAETSDFYSDRADPRLIWVGSIAMFNMKNQDIAIPSDNLNNLNGCNKGEVNLETPYSGLVFKQKETHISNSSKNIIDESKETLDWTRRNTQNMVVLNNNRIVICHNDYDEEGKYKGNSKLEIDKGGISIISSDEEGVNNSKLELLRNGTFTLMNEDINNGNSNILNATNNEISLNRNSDKDHYSIFMGKNSRGEPSCSISLKSGEGVPAEISLEKGSGINITSNGNISINPGQNGKVTLGTGEGYILTSPSPGTFNFDNHPITAVSNAKA